MIGLRGVLDVLDKLLHTACDVVLVILCQTTTGKGLRAFMREIEGLGSRHDGRRAQVVICHKIVFPGVTLVPVRDS